MIICRSILLRMRNVSDKICRENKKNAHIFSNIFPKIMPFMRWCGKMYSRTPQITICIIWRMRIECWVTKVADTRICNACCFSTATIVARTPPNITFYVHCLYCLWLKFSSMQLFDESPAELACLVSTGFPPFSERFIKHSVSTH